MSTEPEAEVIEETFELPDDLASALVDLLGEAAEEEADLGDATSALIPVPLVVSFEESSAGCCVLCSKKAPGWPEVPTGWNFSPAVAEADVPAFLICPECLSSQE